MRAEAIWESRSTSTAPVKHIKELPEYEKLAQEAQVPSTDYETTVHWSTFDRCEDFY